MGSTRCSHAFFQTATATTTFYTTVLTPRWATTPIFSSIHITHFYYDRQKKKKPKRKKKKKEKKNPLAES
jgi:hypothetical protein